MSPRQRDLAFLTLASALLFGLRLGARDLWNPNEPIYGEAVREMTERGSWLVPYVNGLVFGEKPILFYWIALAASWLLGGVSEASLRIPSFLAGIATVLGSYALVWPYAGRRRAIASALFTASLFGVWWNARFVQMDILVTATTLGVVLAVTRVVDHAFPRWLGWALAGGAAGIGFLAKGPVAWLVPGLVVAAYLVASRRLREGFRTEVLAGVVVAIAVAAPWYAALWANGRADVLHEVLIRQNFERFANPWDHAQPPWYYLEYFWIDMAPWAFLAPLALLLPRREPGERRLALLAFLWIGAVVLFFSLSKSKRSPYILPIAPAVAILAAEVAVAFAEDRLTRARRAAVLAFAAGVALVLVALGVALATQVPAKFPAFAGPAGWLAAAALGGGLVTAAVLSRRVTRRGVTVPAAVLVAFLLVYGVASVIALPALDAVKSARPFCEELARRAESGDDVASFDFWHWRAEYAYYLGRPLRRIEGVEALRAAWGGPRRLLVVVEQERLASAREVIGDKPALYARAIGSETTYLFTNR